MKINTEVLTQHLPEYAVDTKINIKNILSAELDPGLSSQQIALVSYAVALSLKNTSLLEKLKEAVVPSLAPEEVLALHKANAIMSMNNVYYRSLHLAEDSELSSLPAKLRMQTLQNPGLPRLDYELVALAISAINGCGMCISAHIKTLKGHGASMQVIQKAIRLAAVLSSYSQVLFQSSLLDVDSQ